MTNPRVTAVRSIELGVRSLDQSISFYNKVWGLQSLAAENGVAHLRGTGPNHHLLTLREQGKASLLAVDFAAVDRAAVDGLHTKARG